MRCRVALVPACLLGLLLLAKVAIACLWDYDTILQERSRFPTALELITGKFLRHSPEFYRWRIADREAKLKSDPDNLAYYDDLAVAYSKTSNHAKAIELMLEKDRKKAGLYETYANLGTFYIFTGDLDQALAFINKALAINPNAHFGREKYQKLLVEYLRERKSDGALQFPLIDTSKDYSGLENFDGGFESFLEKSDLQYDRKVLEQRQAAIQAILGMMRFADYRNPILLEALADLLEGAFSPMPSGREVLFDIDAKQLAARTLLVAGNQVTDPQVREKYRKLATDALKLQTHGPHYQLLEIADIEKAFAVEQAEADVWYSKLRSDELAWIHAGNDPEVEFAKRYSNDPSIVFDASPNDPYLWRQRLGLAFLIPSSILLIGCLTYIVASRWMKWIRSIPQ